MTQYAYYPTTSSSGISKYANFAALPASASNGDFAVTTDTDTLYVYNGVAWVVYPSAAVTGNLTDVGTDGITVTNGTGAVIGTGTSIAQQVSNAAQNGYLSSTDWSTFNGKQSALTFSTGLTNTAGTITVNTSQNIATLSNLTSNGYVKTSGGVGTLGVQAVPIPVADGGSGTTTAFTLGSIIFAGASGVYSQDNANFFWDDTNNRLGIGTAAPAYREHIVMAAAGATDSITWEGSGAGASRKWNWMPDSSGFLYMKNLNEAYYSMVFDNVGRVGFGVGSPTSQLHVVPRQANFIVSIFKGYTSQTADLTEWQDSAATVLSKIDSTGKAFFPNVNVSSLTASQLVATDASKNLVSITALPSGTTATTQTQGDASTNVATTAYVDTGLATKQATLTIGNLTDVGTDGITVTNGTGAVIGTGTSIAQHVADATFNGYLSSTDWSTFNGKQSALTFSTGLTNTTGTITVNTSQNISTLSNLTTNGFVMTSGGTGALSVQTSPLTVAQTTIAAQAISASSIDWSTGTMFTKTLAANTTFTFTGNISGQTIVVRLTNTASNYTVTWPTVRWSGGAAPTMTIGAFSDVYTFIYDGSNFYGSVVQNMS